ncbi:MAG: phosphopantothenoylcysteine decarboxylase [Dehalococcoidia bacterium]|nr:phosphopantothenoylcysteine decarboxylase [Dehalococcoidia bacterium]
MRFIGNRSSGRMGFAIAEAARDRGAEVTIVAGPVSLPTPSGIRRVDVTTVEQMLAALQEATASSHAIIMSAAPADFRPSTEARQKIKKEGGHANLAIELEQNPDIIATLPSGGVRVGFAAETNDLERYAREKVAAKRLDFIVANDVTAAGSGFGTETNQVDHSRRHRRRRAAPAAQQVRSRPRHPRPRDRAAHSAGIMKRGRRRPRPRSSAAASRRSSGCGTPWRTRWCSPYTAEVVGAALVTLGWPLYGGRMPAVLIDGAWTVAFGIAFPLFAGSGRR